MPLVNLPKQKRLPPEIGKAREQKQTTNMAKHNTNLQAVSAIKNLTTPSCSEALDFHSRRFVSSLPETRYVPSQVYFTQNTLQSSRRYLSEKYAQNGNIMISLVVNYFLKSETIQKTNLVQVCNPCSIWKPISTNEHPNQSTQIIKVVLGLKEKKRQRL